MRFVDTNVLLYYVGTAADESQKQQIAADILSASDLATSVQVLQEFYTQATRTGRDGRLTHRQAIGFVRTFMRFEVQPTTRDLMLAAMDARESFQISYWDAAIIEAARILGCTEVVSEDLSDGQNYGGVVVRNPFR